MTRNIVLGCRGELVSSLQFSVTAVPKEGSFSLRQGFQFLVYGQQSAFLPALFRDVSFR